MKIKHSLPSLIFYLLCITFLIVSCRKDDDSSPTGPDINVEERDFNLTDEVTITMVWIPSGSFMMGQQDNEQDSDDDESPRHEVNINYDFWMGKYEITQAQWEAVTGYNRSHFIGENRPVERMSWDKIQEDFLSQVDDDFRLPSEAEWEYACRAGTETRFYWGDDPNYEDITDYAWFKDNSNRETHDVGTKLPNAFGLYDMCGNVYEWCEDDYHSNYNDAPQDGSPWITVIPRYEEAHLVRGGTWKYSQGECRSASRRSFFPEYSTSYDVCGFRLVLIR